MNLDDLIDGKVDVNNYQPEQPAQPAKPAPAKAAEPAAPVDVDTLMQAQEHTAPSAPETPDAPRVEEATAPVAVAPDKPKVTPGAAVLGYVNEPAASMYAPKPIPGSDLPPPQQQSRQMVKDFATISLVLGVIGVIVIALPSLFGVDLPGIKGNPDAPLAWHKKEVAKPLAAPVASTPAPAKEDTPAPVAPTAPAVEVAPAPAAPIDVPVAPAVSATPDPAPALVAPAATVQPPVPQSAPAVESSAAQEVPVANQPAPAPAAQVVPVAPAASVPQPIRREERPAPVKKVSPPKRAVQPSQGPVPGSLEYAEQQMRQFTQPHR